MIVIKNNSIRPLFVFSLIIILSTFSRVSVADDQSSGCGLGWAVTKRKSILSSLVRAYTNMTFSSTFGMTSGTSGCTEHSLVLKEKKGLHYTESNYHQLMVEMAQGQGEYLQAYASVLGCSDQSYPQFAQTLQKNYRQIFPSAQVGPQKVLSNVVDQLKANKVMRSSCQNLII